MSDSSLPESDILSVARLSCEGERGVRDSGVVGDVARDTVREAARLQGFPDEHVFHETIWHSFRMIGNSVSPIIAREILKAVAEAIERGPMAAAA